MHFFIFLKKTKHTHNKQSLLSLERAWGSVFGQCHVGLIHTEQMPLWLGSLLSLLIFSLVWFGSVLPSSNTWHRHIYLTHRGEVGERIIMIGGVALVWTGAQWTLSEAPLWWWHVDNDGLIFAFNNKWHNSYVSILVTTLYVPNMNSWEQWYT